MIVPDTNILIAYSTIQEPAHGIVKQHIVKKTILFSIVAVAEFLVKATSQESELLRRMTDEIGLIDVNKSIMEQAVLYRKEALRKTKRSHILDCFIAATAKIHKATLLTCDKRDYPFPDITVKQPEEVRTQMY